MASIAGMLFGSVADWLTPASTVPSAIQSSQTRNDVVLEEKTALLRRPPGQGPFDGPTRMRVIIVPRGRLAGECWLGVWNAYEEHYPAVELEKYVLLHHSTCRVAATLLRIIFSLRLALIRLGILGFTAPFLVCDLDRLCLHIFMPPYSFLPFAVT